jgi:hypothetical protein
VPPVAPEHHTAHSRNSDRHFREPSPCFLHSKNRSGYDASPAF